MRALAPAALFLFAAACSAAPAHKSASTTAVTDVNQSSVKDQSIGNCWIYATAGWAESLNKSATNQERTLSESYWTYWHWFDQIANGSLDASATSVQSGGTWGTASGLMARYGVMNAADFIPADVTDARSTAQSKAETAINASLKSGALAGADARSDRALVRSELDKAFGLSAAMTAVLDQVFGKDVSHTIDGDADPSNTPIMRPSDLPVAYTDGQSHQVTQATLADMIASGSLSWQLVSYPGDAYSRRQLHKRVQQALNDHMPVVLSWYVDFNALDNQGRFFAPPMNPGQQGGHMVVMEDYEIDNVPGFGTLPAGVPETRPEALQAALDDNASIHFFRVKNSWGNYHSIPSFARSVGYHDLYMAYMNGPVKKCEVDANENPRLDTCVDSVPFWDVLLPPGY